MKSVILVLKMLNFNKSKIDDFPENKTKKVELLELVIPQWRGVVMVVTTI